MKVFLLALLFAAPMPVMASTLTEIRGCTLVATNWADGDSFRIRTPTGEEHTARLYGADCLEWHVTDDSDARRLRAQRRYFGITKVGGSPAASIKLGKHYGELAAKEITNALAKPFVIYSSFADARGDGKYQRIYAFVTTADGKDLAEHLVSLGLARAFGVSRKTYDGRSREEYRAHLADVELLAARKSLGVWSKTEWENLPNERRDQRLEDEEFDLATGTATLDDGEKLNPNTAARDELMRLPGIGETLANRIIEERPYSSAQDLSTVNGIGDETLKKIRIFLDFTPAK